MFRRAKRKNSEKEMEEEGSDQTEAKDLEVSSEFWQSSQGLGLAQFRGFFSCASLGTQETEGFSLPQMMWRAV
jgi:hypothetical protein